MDKLKHCPFCGGKASILHLGGSGGWKVLCINPACTAIVSTLSKNEQEAIKVWNTRPTTYSDNIAFEPNLSDKCKAVRKVFGETQKEFGKRLGIPQSTVSYLEKVTDSYHCRESVRGAIEQINELYDRFVGEENG